MEKIIKDGELYGKIEIFGKVRLYKLTHNWHAEFLDNDVKRLGHVWKVDNSAKHVHIFDIVKGDPQPLRDEPEIISFDAILSVAQGYSRLYPRPVYQGKGNKKVATLEIWTLDEKAALGFVQRRAGRFYVNLINGKWTLR